MSRTPFAYIVASFATAVLINLDTFYLLFTFLYSFRCICLPRLVNKVDQNWSDIISVVKVRGLRGLSPLTLTMVWAPCNMSPPDWIYKVLFYAQITPN